MSSSDDFDPDDFLDELKTIRQTVDWQVENERHQFFDRVQFLIRHWKGRLPDVREIFQAEDIDWILSRYAKSLGLTNYAKLDPLVEFLIKCGYQDEPEIGREGKPSPRRTTPVHHAARRGFSLWPRNLGNLLKIYDRFDVNYTDESGFTHFHAACKFGCDDAVEKFLKAGQDPNVIWKKTGDTPLHLTAYFESRNKQYVTELLLRRGADPNLANAKGFTPLHILCLKDDGNVFVEILFKVCDEKQQLVQIDAKDNSGDTPLNLAVFWNKKETVEALLRRGADPNLANEEGLTPLHYICEDPNDDGMAELFFKVNDETNQLVQVDALDKLGRTPLQYAVAGFLPHVVDLLLDHGADLSKFVFPTESYYGKCFSTDHSKLYLASECLTVVELLEKRGYKLDRSGALTIMKFFVQKGLFAESANLDKSWYDDRKVVRKAKEKMINSKLSLYKLLQLRPKGAAKQLTYTDYYKFAVEVGGVDFLPESHQDACALHLCEKMSRKFFICWALKSFSKLTRYQLPIECCRMIIQPLLNKDLCNITLATRG